MNPNWKANDGIVHLDLKLSKLEKHLFDTFAELLKRRGFQYLSVPTVVERKMLETQELIPISLVTTTDNGKYLSGSAEQGILDWLRDQELNDEVDLSLWSLNECYRKEKTFDGLKRCFQFRKLEQFIAFKNETDWKWYFKSVKDNVENFLKEFGIEYRITDTKDPGYHWFKEDVEIKTNSGWVESHSILYYGDEHSKRFNFTGLPYTIAATGIASPRILIPFVEGRTKSNFNLIRH